MEGPCYQRRTSRRFGCQYRYVLMETRSDYFILRFLTVRWFLKRFNREFYVSDSRSPQKIVILKSRSNKSARVHSRLNFSFASYTTVNARTNTASYNLIDPPALRRKFVLHQLFIRCNVFPIRSRVRDRAVPLSPKLSRRFFLPRRVARFIQVFFSPRQIQAETLISYIELPRWYRRIGFRFVKIIRLKIRFTSVLFRLTYFDLQRIDDRLHGGKDACRKNNAGESERANLLIIRYAFLEIRTTSVRAANEYRSTKTARKPISAYVLWSATRRSLNTIFGKKFETRVDSIDPTTARKTVSVQPAAIPDTSNVKKKKKDGAEEKKK